MAILHGSWLLEDEKSCLFIWGETWRKVGGIHTRESGIILPHPLAMTEAEFKTFLNSLQQSGKLNWQLPETAETPPEKRKKARISPKTQNAEITAPNSSIQREIRAIALPTQISESNANLMPQHSAAAIEEPAKTEEIYLYPWQVEGFCLNPQAAFVFLQSLPLNSTEPDSFVGSDLRFWSHIARWSLDLLARCKFLPGLEKQSDGSAIAKWQPLLDSSTDTLRLATFVKQMPTACRTYQSKEEGSSATDSVTDVTDVTDVSPMEVGRGKKEEGRHDTDFDTDTGINDREERRSENSEELNSSEIVRDIVDNILNDIAVEEVKIRENKPATSSIPAPILRKKPIPYSQSVFLPIAPIELYFDIEAEPELNLDYLHGVLVVDRSNNTEKFHGFLAESAAEEGAIWEQFLELMWAYPIAPIFHFCDYEVKTFKRLAKLYNTPAYLWKPVLKRFVDIHKQVTQKAIMPVER